MAYADNIKDQWVVTNILPNPNIDKELSKLVNHILLNVKSYDKFTSLPVNELIASILKFASINEKVYKKELQQAGINPSFRISNNIKYQLITLMIRVYNISGNRHQKIFKTQGLIALIALIYMSNHKTFWPKVVIEEAMAYTITNKLPINSLWRKFETPIQYFVFLKDETAKKYDTRFEDMTVKEQTDFITLLYNKIRSVMRNVAVKYYDVVKSKEYKLNVNNEFELILRTVSTEVDKAFRFSPYNQTIVNDSKQKFGTPIKTSIAIYKWLSTKPDMFVDLVRLVLTSVKPSSYKMIVTPQFEIEVFKNLKTKAIKGDTVKVKKLVDVILNSYLEENGFNKLLSFSTDKVVKLRKTVLFLAFSHIIESVTYKI